MTDFVGTFLDVGDKAVYSRLLGSKLVMDDVEVIGFTDSKVKITALSVNDERRGYSLANPNRLVVWEKGTLCGRYTAILDRIDVEGKNAKETTN